jgi:polar amino acid transport system substrate-binding protein
MKNRSIPLIIAFLIGLTLLGKAEEIFIVTEDYPPYNFEEEGEITGFSTEIVNELVKRVGIKSELDIYPWKRAYDLALREKNILIFTITKSEQREALFKWVGPIASRKIFLFRLEDRIDIKINNLEDVKKYVTGIVPEDALGQYLLNNGFEVGLHLERVPTERINIKKFFNRRIDLVGNTELNMAYSKENLGFKSYQVEKAFEIPHGGDYYLAFSKKTSDTIVLKFQQALDQIKQDGTYKKIKLEYLK